MTVAILAIWPIVSVSKIQARTWPTFILDANMKSLLFSDINEKTPGGVGLHLLRGMSHVTTLSLKTMSVQD